MDGTKKLKKAEVLFREGDAVDTLYLVQSGRIGMLLERNGKRFSIGEFGPGHVIGEGGLYSTARHGFLAEALQETKLVEVPMDNVKQLLEKSAPAIKLMVRGLVEELKAFYQNQKVEKLANEKVPCPQGLLARMFTEIHLLAKHLGKKPPVTDEAVALDWGLFKNFAIRFFGESPQRLRHLMDLLSKVKMAELKITKNSEEEDELQTITIANLQDLEDFAEFYQYHLFKGSRAEAIFVDPLALKVARAMYEVSQVAEVDHHGASKMEFSILLNECKVRFGLDLKNTHFAALEKKGLFVKKQSADGDKVFVSFDRNEFGKMVRFWSIIHEVDKWNERGFVDLNEKEEVAKAGTGGACPSCNGAIDTAHKFCPGCGQKLAA